MALDVSREHLFRLWKIYPKRLPSPGVILRFGKQVPEQIQKNHPRLRGDDILKQTQFSLTAFGVAAVQAGEAIVEADHGARLAFFA